MFPSVLKQQIAAYVTPVLNPKQYHMKRLLFVALGTLATFQLSAQHDISLSLNAGIGKTAPKYTGSNTFFSTRYSHSYAPTFGVNATYAYAIGNYSIESGLSFNDLKGNQTEGADVTVIENDEFRIVEKDREIKRKMRYLTVPLTLNYRTDKLRLGIGVYASYLVQTEQNVTDYSEGEITAFYPNKQLTQKFDYGIVGQVSFDITERASVLFTTNWGWIDLQLADKSLPALDEYQYGYVYQPLRNQQFMLGLKYRLYKS